MILLPALLAQASVSAQNSAINMMTIPAMTVPNKAPLANRFVPMETRQFMRAPQTQQFTPYLEQAPPVEYVPVYGAMQQGKLGSPGGIKKVAKPAKSARAKLEYDKSRTPGSDSFVREEDYTENKFTAGRYGLDESKQRELPERAEGPKYASGYGFKKPPARRGSVAAPRLEEENSVLGSAIAMLLGMVVGSSVTYIVAAPRFVSKQMGSPEPLLASV